MSPIAMGVIASSIKQALPDAVGVALDAVEVEGFYQLATRVKDSRRGKIRI